MVSTNKNMNQLKMHLKSKFLLSAKLYWILTIIVNKIKLFRIKISSYL